MGCVYSCIASTALNPTDAFASKDNDHAQMYFSLIRQPLAVSVLAKVQLRLAMGVHIEFSFFHFSFCFLMIFLQPGKP